MSQENVEVVMSLAVIAWRTGHALISIGFLTSIGYVLVGFAALANSRLRQTRAGAVGVDTIALAAPLISPPLITSATATSVQRNCANR